MVTMKLRVVSEKPDQLSSGVSGHEILNADGQVLERWRPAELNADGQQICPTRS
jgi:hypothetical protein